MLISNPLIPWQHYVNRQDNVGLSVMEVKNKYMQEQLLFEQQMNFMYHQQRLMSQHPSGGGRSSSTIPSGSGDNTINSYVEDDYVEDYFI